MDMLRQLFLHHDYVLSLLQDGYYLEALRYARKYKVCFFIVCTSRSLSFGNSSCVPFQLGTVDFLGGLGESKKKEL